MIHVVKHFLTAVINTYVFQHIAFSMKNKASWTRKAIWLIHSKSQAQFFGGIYMGRIYMYVHRDECSYVYKYLCLYYIFQKKIQAQSW
jgi:hypothetical protein